MSEPGEASKAIWQPCTPTFTRTLPVLEFPFKTLPDIYAPASTVLKLKDGSRINAFQWCYLRRKSEGRGERIKSFETTSLCEDRVKAMPVALERLSRWIAFKNSRAQSVKAVLTNLSHFIFWADHPQNDGRLTSLLTDPDVAFEALRGYHTHLHSRLQSHQFTAGRAALLDQTAISCLSEIHGLEYRDRIEPIQWTNGDGTKAPGAQAVGTLVSMLQGIFDSAAAMSLAEQSVPGERQLRASATDDTKVVQLSERYGPLRLMELACAAYTALVFADSGANLSVLQEFEEPDDLGEQLAVPDRVNLTQKAVKFRAGAKIVEVHLSSTTITRLNTFLRVRQKLVASLGGADITPMFILCRYECRKGEPLAVRPLDQNFLKDLRKKVAYAGVILPAVTLRQLRVYKQQELVRRVPVPVAATMLGQTIQTAIRSYCKATEATRLGEMTGFLASLHDTVQDVSAVQAIPIGGCANHGDPSPISHSMLVTPDCMKAEGCLFCRHFRVHADVEDLRKLMSCRQVLIRIAPLANDTLHTERFYTAVVDRIEALLIELKRRQPKAHEAVRMEVEDRGELTPYWARKLQQLHLLGMLTCSAAV